MDLAAPSTTTINALAGSGNTTIVCVNGNESRDWHEETELLAGLKQAGYPVVIVDPRGVGLQRSRLKSRSGSYTNPLDGVEENIAYNAFLVGKSLVGMRVADILAAVRQLGSSRLVLCGRRDAAILVCLAAAVEPRIRMVAAEDLLTSFRPLFAPQGQPLNAASILPGLLHDFGDVDEILAAIAPRKVLLGGRVDQATPLKPNVRPTAMRFSENPKVLTSWIGE